MCEWDCATEARVEVELRTGLGLGRFVRTCNTVSCIALYS